MSSESTSTDPDALPFPVAWGIPLGLFCWSTWLWLRHRGRWNDAQELVFHGLAMFLISLHLGLLIPHAKVKKFMLLAHSIGLLQGLTLVVFGSIWNNFVGFDNAGRRRSAIAKWLLIYSFWAGTVADLLAAMTGAKELFYLSKYDLQNVQASEAAEMALQILLKPSGICNMVAVAMMLHQMANSHGDKKQE